MISIVDPNVESTPWACFNYFAHISVYAFVAFKPIIYVLSNVYFKKAFFDTYPCFKPNDYAVNVAEYPDSRNMSMKSVPKYVSDYSSE